MLNPQEDKQMLQNEIASFKIKESVSRCSQIMIWIIIENFLKDFFRFKS